MLERIEHTAAEVVAAPLVVVSWPGVCIQQTLIGLSLSLLHSSKKAGKLLSELKPGTFFHTMCTQDEWGWAC